MILRFLVIQSLMLWQGGFFFYSLVVVPIGSEILGPIDQGFVTQRVTVWMNVFGLACLTLIAVDCVVAKDTSRLRKRVRVGLLILDSAIVLFLFRMHVWMDDLLDANDHTIKSQKSFYLIHELYLCMVGAQWFFMLAFVWLTLTAWRSADSAVKQSTPPSERS